MDWLDTETKALLQHSPPKNLRLPIRRPSRHLAGNRGARSQRPCEGGATGSKALEDEAGRLLSGRLPVCVKKGLSYTDGQIGQFELICCDAVSVIIADEVLANAPPDYLTDPMQSFARLTNSS